MATRIIRTLEVSEQLKRSEGEVDTLCLQQCIYQYDNGDSDEYFRFIRRGPDGKYKAQRGQAGIPDLYIIDRLVLMMKKEMGKRK